MTKCNQAHLKKLWNAPTLNNPDRTVYACTKCEELTFEDYHKYCGGCGRILHKL